MLNRRQLLSASIAAAPVLVASIEAAAKEVLTYTPRGTMGRLQRLPSVDVESSQAFYSGYRQWINSSLTQAAQERADEIMKAHGIDPGSEVSMDDVFKLMGNDQIMGTYTHAWERSQALMWAGIRDAYHARADQVLSAFAVADKAGPGTLEINPTMHIPEYTTHEIHLQPGGYVGDPFAGLIYQHGENVVFNGDNYQDQAQVRLAAAVPLPADGKVRRIHEPGCSIGQLTQALKERFRDAEVWGTDIGAPMIRYAHMRAADMGVEVHYAQRLAEDTKFPENHFDMVVDNLLLHEITAAAARKMFAENFRTLRPGGIYYPIDLHTGSPKPKTAYQKYQAWRDHRWNDEIWRMQYASYDLPEELRKVGFKVVDQGPPARANNSYNVLAIKPA